MKIRQLSVFLENRSGRLLDVAGVLGRFNINIKALSLADTSDYGILRIIVNTPDEARQILKKAGFTISETDVIAVEVGDIAGGLARVLSLLDKHGLNVEYMYAFIEKTHDNAVLIFRIADIDKATGVLASNGINILTSEQVMNL